MSRITSIFLLGAITLISGIAHAQQILIGLDATPPFSALRPFSEPTLITLSFRSPDGATVSEGNASIALEAPPHGRIFSTDFPFVEGSRLLNVQLPIRSGTVRWEYLFPIRGEYRMTVNAVAGERRGSQSFAIRIREKEQKWLFLGVFTAALFAAGFFAGRIFTGSQRKLVLLLALIGSLSLAGSLMADGKPSGEGEIQISPAPVGDLSRIRWVQSGSGVSSSRKLSLKITHLETQKTVFAVTEIPVEDEFAFDLEFTDGDEYSVDALSQQDGNTTRSERTVGIVAREPPIRASAPSLIFFVAVVAGGLWSGRWSRHRPAN